MSSFKSATPTLLQTEDGSHTLFLEELNETYHSHAGALTESVHVFINHGFKCVKNLGEIRVLEVGFGTGLNAILTYKEHLETRVKTLYHTLEPYPIPEQLLSEINLGEMTQNENWKTIWTQMHHTETNKEITFSEGFSFARFQKTLQDFEPKKNFYDVIYFDAFAPRKQPEMWEIEQLEKCVESLKSGGIFITYCANGQFKRNLKSLGLKLNNPPGIKGRREITQGMK